MTKIEWAIVAASVAGLLFSGWQINNGYRYVNTTYERAQACEKTNCETLIATIDAVDMRPPKMIFNEKPVSNHKPH